MYLINPTKYLIIRKNPIYKGTVISCDQLNSDYSTKQEKGSYEGTVVSAFAYFCNEGIIDRKGWVQVSPDEIPKAFEEAKQKLKQGELYYGSI